MKHTFAIILSLIFSQLLFATPANEIPVLRNPAPEIFTSGQPTELGFQLLAQAGIKTVINVLPEKHCLTNEQDIISANKMTYRTIPFNNYQLSVGIVQRFADVLENSPKPVLIHCATGNHVAGLWLAYRVLIQKERTYDAIVEAREIGIRPQLEKDVVAWIYANQDQF